MKKAKTRAQRRRVAMLRKVLLTLTLVMVVAMVTVGGTIAWLADKTESIVNTFTVGDINIELTEEKGTVDENGNHEFHIVPGVDIEKDPTVTVLEESEKCYLFVKVTEANWPAFVDEDGSRKVDYQIAAGWTELETGVYWRIVESSESAQPFTVLADNKVTVSENLTKMDAEQITVAPTLTFQAFAVQHAEIADAEDAWEQAKTAANYPTNP